MQGKDNECEGGSREIIKMEERYKEKDLENHDHCLNDSWDNTKHSKIWIIGVLEEEDKERGTKSIYAGSPKPFRRNIKKTIFRHIIVNLRKIPITKTEKFEQNNNIALDNNLKYEINIHAGMYK